MTKNKVQENYPLPELIDVELSENAKHYGCDHYREFEAELIGEIVHFCDTHDYVEIDLDKVESFSMKTVSEGLDILVRMEGDPIE